MHAIRQVHGDRAKSTYRVRFCLRLLTQENRAAGGADVSPIVPVFKPRLGVELACSVPDVVNRDVTVGNQEQWTCR